MAEFKVEGEALKSFLKFARNQPVSFAFAPGTSDLIHYLAMHKRKSPPVIAKAARKAAQANKVAYGTLAVDNRNMILTCEKIVNNLAKKLKKHLADDKVLMNIIVLDQFGNVLESDVEEIEGPDLLAGAASIDDQDSPEDALDALDEVLDEVEPEDGLDPAALAVRAKALEPRVTGLDSPLAPRLREALQKAIQEIRAGHLDEAAAALDKLDTALAKIAAAIPVDPEAQRALAARAAGLKDQIAAMGETETAARLTKALAQARELIRDKQLAKATETLDAITQVRHRTISALETRLTDLSTRLEGQTGPMADKLAKGATAAESALAAGHIAQAQKALETLTKALTTHEETRRLVKSHQAWRVTKEGLHAELAQIKATTGETAQRFAALNTLDTQLETALETLVDTQDPGARTRLKAQARAILAEYRSELDTPLYKVLDSGPGIVNVSVRSKAVEALNSVNEALQ